MLELLVVMAILAVLAALLLPVIAQAKRKAQRTQCASNLHQITIALHGYVADNQAYPIGVYWAPLLSRQGLGIPFTKGVWLCPSAVWYTNRLPSGFFPFSYAYNANGVADYPQIESFGVGGLLIFPSLSNPPTRDSDLARPDDMIAIGEGSLGVVLRRENLPHVAEYGNIYDRHQGRAGVALCDGHVEFPTLAFLDEETNDTALARWNRDHQPHRDLLPP